MEQVQRWRHYDAHAGQRDPAGSGEKAAADEEESALRKNAAVETIKLGGTDKNKQN